MCCQGFCTFMVQLIEPHSSDLVTFLSHPFLYLNQAFISGIDGRGCCVAYKHSAVSNESVCALRFIWIHLWLLKAGKLIRNLIGIYYITIRDWITVTDYW